MSTYLFPGQGSQVKGMGESLFAQFPEIVTQADNILGYSITQLCLQDPNGYLNQTQFTQPALYVVNALHYLKKQNETGVKPHYVAGHSLGEYNALHAAEVFNFETGLKLVQKRGELMSKASGGGMAAVIGLKNETVQLILQKENLTDISIANQNSYTQVVISGSQHSIKNAQSLFEKAGASLYIPLKVSGAFHSPHMKDAQQNFAEFLNQFTFHPPVIPVIANVTAKPYQDHEIARCLAEQITSPVQWAPTLEYLLKQGETEFVEVGPGTVLTGLTRRIRNGQ